MPSTRKAQPNASLAIRKLPPEVPLTTNPRPTIQATAASLSTDKARAAEAAKQLAAVQAQRKQNGC